MSSLSPESSSPRAGSFTRVLSAFCALWNLSGGLLLAEAPERPATAAHGDRVSFVNEIMPLLAKAGCSAGGCHAKPEGQNNFKLSVFGYDPQLDFNEIVHDAHGRRLFFAAPEESLLLLKATGSVPHEGGSRFEKDSAPYRRIVAWISQGAPFDPPDTPRLNSIRVEPREPVLQPGAQQALNVSAIFSDGSRKDVTALALYDSADKALFTADGNGLLTAGSLRGEAVVVVNYMGAVDVARPVVPPVKTLAAADFAGFPVQNEADTLIHRRLQSLGLLPSEQCSDSEFIRRSALDCIGRLPTAEEARAFLADAAPDRRSKWISKILADPNYADHWAVKWGDLIRPNPARVGVKPVFLLDLWLRDMFRRNVPYDAMVRELLTAQGNSHQFGPVAVVRDKREPVDASAFVSQIFLGVRMECAKCHHHPSEKWAQEDYYQFAAFFGKMRSRGQGISAPISGEVEMWWYDPAGKGVNHPLTEALLTPKVPDGPEIPYTPGVDPRAQLVDWMVHPQNPFFARAIVNRIWGEFLGKGIVDPVDDFRASNPPSNPELLDWLSADFVAHQFDLKHLMRRIMETAVYQRSSLANASNAADQRNFARSLRRRLPAEVLLDAVGDLTGSREPFGGLAAGSRAVQTWNHKLTSEFMDAFGRPNPSLECPCERERKPTVVQSLHLMNANGLQAKLAAPSGRVAAWAAAAKPPEEVVREIYLSAYARHPDAEEFKAALAHLGRTEAPRAESVQDLVWAVINTPEFVFNH
jgi:hypothetical protein